MVVTFICGPGRCHRRRATVGFRRGHDCLGLARATDILAAERLAVASDFRRGDNVRTEVGLAEEDKL